MITGIEGEILKKEPGFCDLLTAGGVIYRLSISLNTYGTLNEKRARLLTTLIVREDALLLYGFAEEGERALFDLLLKVSGVGPKSAMAILSTYTPAQFAEVIQTRNEARLIKVPGIGKKTAGLILVQLAGTVDALGLEGANDAVRQAAQALESLGFKMADITRILAKCAATDTAGLVKEALKFFQK